MKKIGMWPRRFRWALIRSIGRTRTMLAPVVPIRLLRTAPPPSKSALVRVPARRRRAAASSWCRCFRESSFLPLLCLTHPKGTLSSLCTSVHHPSQGVDVSPAFPHPPPRWSPFVGHALTVVALALGGLSSFHAL